MSKPILFVTGLGSELQRAENMNALYEAYPGEKVFMHIRDRKFLSEIIPGKHDVMVIDVFPDFHPCTTVMMWHAIQGGKYIGLDEQNDDHNPRYYRPELAKNMDYIIAAGSGGRDMMSQCTGVPVDRIYDLGMPRTDRYIHKKKGDGHTALAEKRAYLYVPTFRHWYETPLPVIDWEWFDEQLTDDEILAVKSHPYGSKVNLKGFRHIIEIPQMEPSVNYLYDCDVVITDYSSIMFDGYLLKKPCVLFEKNPGYCMTRGMYLEYPKQYSSRYARNEEQLLEQIRSAKRLTKVEKRCMFYTADACDGHSIERIIEFLKEQNGGN